MKFSDLLNKKTINNMKSNTTEHHKKVVHQANSKRAGLADRRMQNMCTLDDAAKLCGVSTGIIHRWETTGMTPNDTVISIKKYAKLLRMNYDDLVKLLK